MPLTVGILREIIFTIYLHPSAANENNVLDVCVNQMNVGLSSIELGTWYSSARQAGWQPQKSRAPGWVTLLAASFMHVCCVAFLVWQNFRVLKS